MPWSSSLLRHLVLVGVVLAVVVLAGVPPTGELRAQNDGVARPDAANRVEPNVVQYRSDRLHVVAAHYYNRRAHAPRWLLLDVGILVLSGGPLTVARRDFSIVRPDGVEVPLASQRDFRRARAELAPLHVQLHFRLDPVTGNYPAGRRCGSHGFRFLVDSGIRQSVVYANRTGRCVRGDLYFASPTGAWPPGTYALVIGGNTDVRLPIAIY